MRLASLLLFLCTPLAVCAQEVEPTKRAHGITVAPYGFISFCTRGEQAVCATTQGAPTSRVIVDTKKLAELDQVNRSVNLSIKGVSDQIVFGVSEYWAVGKDRGDCEDYVLRKQQELLQLGWPLRSLLIAVVNDENNEGHAVLVVRTSQDDWVLDNKTDEILRPRATKYVFTMRQSEFSPMVWVALMPLGVTTAATK